MTPLNQWLICGKPIDMYAANRGCTCRHYDPTEFRMKAAIARRKREEGNEAR